MNTIAMNTYRKASTFDGFKMLTYLLDRLIFRPPRIITLKTVTKPKKIRFGIYTW